MEDNKYTIERLSSNNIHQVAGLYQIVFKKYITEEEIKKKYDTKSFGAENIGYLAFTNDNQLAAFYGVIPCIIQLDQRSILVAQSTDTMTHMDHRKQGLFILLAQKTYKLAAENNIKFVFGFPNQNSFEGFIKLRWEFVPEKLQSFRLKTSVFPYAKLIFKSKRLSRVYIQIIRRILSNKITINAIFSASKRNSIQHDEQFISYKKHNQGIFTRIANVDLWIKIDGILKIGFAKIPENFDVLLFKKILKKTAALLGCSEASFITNKNSSLYNALIPIIPPADSLPVGFYNLSHEQFEFEKIEFEYCDIDTF